MEVDAGFAGGAAWPEAAAADSEGAASGEAAGGPWLVVDGQNVVRHYLQEKHIAWTDASPDVRGIELCLEALRDNGLHRSVVVIPTWWYTRKPASGKGNATMETDSWESLSHLKAAGKLALCPNDCHDDALILDLALAYDGFVVTNDRFRDHAGNPYDSAWIQRRRLPFTFVPHPRHSDERCFMLLKEGRDRLQRHRRQPQQQQQQQQQQQLLLLQHSSQPQQDACGALTRPPLGYQFSEGAIKNPMRGSRSVPDELMLDLPSPRGGMASADSGAVRNAEPLRSPSAGSIPMHESSARDARRPRECPPKEQRRDDAAALVTHVMQIPASAAGRVIGKGGSNVASIEVATGARVNVARGAEADGEETRRVTIQGSFLEVEHAKLLVQEKVDAAARYT